MSRVSPTPTMIIKTIDSSEIFFTEILSRIGILGRFFFIGTQIDFRTMTQGIQTTQHIQRRLISRYTCLGRQRQCQFRRQNGFFEGFVGFRVGDHGMIRTQGTIVIGPDHIIDGIQIHRFPREIRLFRTVKTLTKSIMSGNGHGFKVACVFRRQQ